MSKREHVDVFARLYKLTGSSITRTEILAEYVSTGMYIYIMRIFCVHA